MAAQFELHHQLNHVEHILWCHQQRERMTRINNIVNVDQKQCF